MWKIVLFASLLPTVIAIVLRKFFCERALKKMRHGVTNQTGERVAAQMLRYQEGMKETEVKQAKKTRLVSGDVLRIDLSRKMWEGKTILDLGKVANLVGRACVAKEHGDLLAWRDWAVRFGWAFPAFTLLVVVFAVAVAKLGVLIGLVIVSCALGLSSTLLLLTMTVELEAAKRGAYLVEKSHALPRPADGEEVAKCCRALAWKRVVPGVLEWAVGGSNKAERNSLETEGE